MDGDLVHEAEDEDLGHRVADLLVPRSIKQSCLYPCLLCSKAIKVVDNSKVDQIVEDLGVEEGGDKFYW